MRIQREVGAEEGRSQREREAQQRISAEDAIERARIAHEAWMGESGGRETRREISRAWRWALARQRALRLTRNNSKNNKNYEFYVRRG